MWLTSHNLAIETGRYSKTVRKYRKYFAYTDYVEDEFYLFVQYRINTSDFVF